MLRHAYSQLQLVRLTPRFSTRYLRTSTAFLAKPLPPRPKIDEADIEEAFLKGSGPGGQKINKTSSAVQLRHTPTGIVVKSQATRSRSQNRKIARTLLAERLEVLEKGDESRTVIKEKLKSRKKASAAKKSRRKYRLLESAEGSEDGNEGKGGPEKKWVEGGDAGREEVEGQEGKSHMVVLP